MSSHFSHYKQTLVKTSFGKKTVKGTCFSIKINLSWTKNKVSIKQFVSPYSKQYYWPLKNFGFARTDELPMLPYTDEVPIIPYQYLK